MSLVLLTTNTYDQLRHASCSPWLFFGLTAGALVIVRRRESAARNDGIAWMPGHPFTTFAFIAVAVGIVINSFVAYPAQSLIGSGILTIAAVIFFGIRR